MSFLKPYLFIGLAMTVKPDKRLVYTTKRNLNITNVLLDVEQVAANCKKTTQLWVEMNKEQYLIANLSRQMPQYAPDIGFEKDLQIVFFTKGGSDVHVNGYIEFDASFDDGELDVADLT